ncbi:ABC transporter ATP-binding protein [Agaribacterium sp. ZY112]|uniref:ABC transporter ATP-binding protein n=1 Tax=Agaribacterium sp. ZY112 TaxID=3233574 RepID=UPI0035254D13
MSIEVKALRFAYADSPNKAILNINHWQVTAQEQVFIHGPSGSGKSTLLNILGGILKTSEGHVSVLNQQLNQLNSRQRDRFRAQNMGYIFQQFNLVPYLNAVENIQLGTFFSKEKNADRSAITTLLNELNIKNNDHYKPCSQLSIGQQQRVAIARALINKPKLLIADEASSAIDHANRDKFMQLLMALSKEQQASLLFVSHDISLSHHFQRIDAMSQINSIEAEA